MGDDQSDRERERNGLRMRERADIEGKRSEGSTVLAPPIRERFPLVIISFSLRPSSPSNNHSDPYIKNTNHPLHSAPLAMQRVGQQGDKRGRNAIRKSSPPLVIQFLCHVG